MDYTNKINSLQYKILSKNAIHDPQDMIDYANAYSFWYKNWKDIFTSVGSPEAFIVDDFYRADIIPVIKSDGLIVGMACSTHFNAQNPCIKDMRYFSIFTDQAKSWMDSHNPKCITSMEFLTVHNEFRKSLIGFSLGEVLIQLSFQLMAEYNSDMTIGVAVKAAGVERLAMNVGASLIGTDVKRGNLYCNLVAAAKSDVLSRHPEAQVDNVIKKLWNSREYSTADKHQRKVA